MKEHVISGARAGARQLARQEQRFLVLVAVLVLCAMVATFLGPRAGAWRVIPGAGFTEFGTGSTLQSQACSTGRW